MLSPPPNYSHCWLKSDIHSALIILKTLYSFFFPFPDAVINSAWFFFCSFGLMLAASVLCAFGLVAAKAKILAFVAGIAFIVSGNFSKKCLLWPFLFIYQGFQGTEGDSCEDEGWKPSPSLEFLFYGRHRPRRKWGPITAAQWVGD